MIDRRLGFGAFLPPFHPPGQDPTLAMRRDLDLVGWLDELGFDEVWVGEHHSGGWATISAPEVFIAAAAERTRRIRMGTGVVSLPYHHPLMVASRIVQLDHMTRGRCLFGVGAGVLPSDAHMLGIEPGDQRRMMEESLTAILHLLTSEEPLTRRTSWYELRDARLQLRPYSQPLFEVAVASSASPVGMRIAGQYGLSPLSLGGARPGTGRAGLSQQWAIAEAAAAAHGRTLRRESWRVVMTVHVAPSREEALADVRDGARRWVYEYFRDTAGAPVAFPDGTAGRELDAMVEAGLAIVGSVDDCVAAVERVIEMTGGFGKLLVTAQDWAPRDRMLRSFELLARHVVPHFRGALAGPLSSQRWVSEHRHEFFEKAARAQQEAAATGQGA